jgi:Ni,Fe-hydrogenase III small subunit/Pyruvate/2-oxoacid:ferredoxin oxidoreductase delta subunit
VFDILYARFQQGYRTIRYPDGPPPALPPRFVGRPAIDNAQCSSDCKACADVCPTDAIRLDSASSRVSLDMGLCLFCRECETACPTHAIRFTSDHRLAAAERDDLVLCDASGPADARLDEPIRKLFGRSLKLRQVSAGGCNACEADTNVLGTVGWDLGRFGIQFVASPRHADGLLITGPVPENMRLALKKTYDAVPSPKIVIAVGACAISGGPYAGHPEVPETADAIVPVDLYIPGCPPHPLTILDGLLELLGRRPK